MDNGLHLSLRADLTPEVVRELREGKPLEICFLDPSGQLVVRDTVEYDSGENPACRKSFCPAGELLEIEEWQRDEKGRLVVHSLSRGDGTPVYVEKWTRGEDGSTIKAEAWHYDETGRQVDHKEISGRRLVGMRGAQPLTRGISWAKPLCFAMGMLCLFFGLNFFLAGKAGMAVFAGLVGAFNLYNAFKKR